MADNENDKKPENQQNTPAANQPVFSQEFIDAGIAAQQARAAREANPLV